MEPRPCHEPSAAPSPSEPHEPSAAPSPAAPAAADIRRRAPTAQGYLVLETERGRREYALGPSTSLDGELPVLDWRTAPLAEVLLRHAPGELYEVNTAGRSHEGRVLERWIVTRAGLIGDERVRSDGSDGSDGAEGGGGRDHPSGEARVRPGGGEQRRPRPQPVRSDEPDRSQLVVLDPVQRAAVELPSDQSLVIDGEAGVGKTLVALHRVAALARRAEARGRRFRALVLVPTEGLRRLVRLLAGKLGLGKLQLAIELFDQWMLARARAAFPGLPRRTSEGAPPQVIAFKRHPAVRAVLGDFDRWKAPRGVERDDQLARSRLRLLHLWGDRPRLEQIISSSQGELAARTIAALQQHTRLQFEATTEAEHRHVDADRLVALDGRALDAGTERHDAHTFDLEDVPILFELARRGGLPLPELPRHDHVVLDEAQLRSPLELAMVGDALAPGGTVTLAGDHRQASDESAWFAGWPAAKQELGRPSWHDVTLEVTYRSVPAISDFARAIVERSARLPDEPPADPAVWATRCEHALAQAAQICWHLDALLARDPWRQICVIGRTPDHARRLHAELRGLDATLVLDGDFRFEPGVLVTTAGAVSGLEFDAVVIPDLTPSFYPAQRELARALYVAATRARDWLWLLTPDEWSPLVDAAS
jgi:DNA helicase II / ATP-dependent DNA helicase PcrA